MLSKVVSVHSHTLIAFVLKPNLMSAFGLTVERISALGFTLTQMRGGQRAADGEREAILVLSIGRDVPAME